MELLMILIGLGVGGLATYLIIRPKLKEKLALDQEIIQANEKAKTELSNINARKDEANKSLLDINAQIVESTKLADETAEKYAQTALERAMASIETSLEAAGRKYQSYEEDYENEYHKMMEELVEDMNRTIQIKQESIRKLTQRESDLSRSVASAVEAAKRTAEMENEKDFYRIVLSDVDIDEIKKLREVLPYLRNGEPLNKVIWKVYYEKPTTDMIGRVLGSNSHCGIYKITNLANQMCYVGQAVNVSERWKQHVKRGVGAETPTRNKLYPTMYAVGVENFSFELIEECPREQLNEREDYWQEYFKAKEFGYSIK